MPHQQEELVDFMFAPRHADVGYIPRKCVFHHVDRCSGCRYGMVSDAMGESGEVSSKMMSQQLCVVPPVHMYMYATCVSRVMMIQM